MKGKPIKGVCSHAYIEAEAAGDGWAAWRDKHWPEWHDNTGAANSFALERIGCNWRKHILEMYGRWTVWAGAEEFYGESLCMECLQEMMDQLKEIEQ